MSDSETTNQQVTKHNSPSKKLIVVYPEGVLKDPIALPNVTEYFVDGNTQQLVVHYMMEDPEKNIKAEVVQKLTPGYIYSMEIAETKLHETETGATAENVVPFKKEVKK